MEKTFEKMAEKLIQEAERLPISMLEFVNGLNLVAGLIKERADMSEGEIEDFDSND
jgi:hypothetical protein